MSTTVDSRVVEMRFDNKQFESGVATTISSLDKLKQKLNLDGATKGMENIDAAAKKVNMSSLGNAVDTVGVRFNALWTIADQTLRNITNSAYATGERLLKSLTIEPIKTGLQEYETQINAVQTILANTESKGTTLEDVNGALDELNTYADKTIYNFTEMTRNIGTFTAAGVDLDTSVSAIQGIANLAAVSGSTSQQASTAMYQLSQAMASGTVKLMDWNSVVNAGMGGQVFQDALKETARVHGVNVDAMIKKHGSFRESLTEGWITTDILTETLSHFTMAAEEGSEQWNEFKKSLMDQGYSEEQALAILKMANTATDAATKVKTASQLLDTLKETAQSGWTQTWEIIFGDFEEAKNLFSELYSTFAPIIEASAKVRNELLEGWAQAGGRADLLESMRNIFEGIGNIVKPIKEAFREIFPPTTVEQLVNFTAGIKNLTERFKNLFAEGSENANRLKSTFKGLFAILDIAKQIFGAVFKAIAPLFGGLGSLGGGVLGLTAKFGDWLVSVSESIRASGFLVKAVEKIHAVFAKIKEFLQPVIDGFKNFGNEVSANVTAAAGNIEKRLGPLAVLGNFIKAVFVGIGNVVKKIFPYVAGAASAIGGVLGDLMERITNSIQNADYNALFDIANGGIMTAIGVYIAKMFKSGSDIMDNASGLLENIKGILGGVGDALGAFTDSLKADTLKKIATAIAILAVSLLVLSLIPSEKLTTALLSITTLFGELMGSMAIFGKIGDVKGIGKISAALVALASALLVLSLALKIMSTMSWSEMSVGLITMTVGLGELVGAVWLLSMVPEKDLKKSTKAIKTLASSLLILSIALKIMGSMSWSEMGVALISMTVGLGAMVGAVALLPQDTGKRAAGLIGLAAAMVILGVALKIMGSMSWQELAIGLTALAGSLAILAGAMYLMQGAIPGALAMLIVAPALVVLAGAMKILGTMSWEEVGRGLTALGGALGILALGLTLMIAALPGAAALLVAAAALAILTPVLMLLGSMSLAEIGKSLLMIAGVFVVLGLAALVLQPLVPTILALSGSLALLGVACVAIGAGVIMLGLGLTMIATAGSAAALALVTIVSSLASILPYLAKQVGVYIITLCETIAGGAAAICEAVTVIVLAVVDALVEAVPYLVDGALVLLISLLESLITYLPTIVNYLVKIVVDLLYLLVDHIPTLLEAVFVFVAALLDGIAANISLIIDPLVNLFGAIFQGIADVIGPIIQSVIAPVLSILADLVVGIVEAIAPYIPELTEMFTTITTVIADAIVKIVEAIAPFLPDIKEMIDSICNVFITLLEQLAPVIDSITGLVRVLGDVIIDIFTSVESLLSTLCTSICDILTAFGDVVDEVCSGATEVLGGIEGVFDSAFGGIADVFDSVGGVIQTFLEGLEGIISAVGEAALNTGKGFEKLAGSISRLSGLGIDKIAGVLGSIATGLASINENEHDLEDTADAMWLLSGGIDGAAASIFVLKRDFGEVAELLSSMKSLITDTASEFSSASSVMETAGGELMNSLVNGISSNTPKFLIAVKSALMQFVMTIESQTNTAKKAFTTLVTSCAESISKKASLFRSAAKDLVKGFANGISEYTYLATAKARAMADAADKAAREELGINSPSRVFKEIGSGIPEGFAMGIAMFGGSIKDAVHGMSDTALGAISQSISRISDAINSDIDAQPTIRPVIDLSDVKSGVSAMNGMLDMDSSVGVRANITAINSMMNQRVQNGTNAEVVSAIDKLRNSIGKIGGDTYQINGVTYDDGSNITDAVRTIVRAARIEGRV